MKLSTRLFALAALSLALATTSAFADFRPGRVRAGAISDMVVTKATGDFEGQANVKLAMNYEDGKADPVSLTLTVPGFFTSTFKVIKIKKGACGDKIVAGIDGVNVLGVSKLELVDYTNIQCRMLVAQKWQAKFTVDQEMGPESSLEFQGNPEFLAVTM